MILQVLSPGPAEAVLLSAWPREALSRGSQAGALLPVTRYPEEQLGTRYSGECSFFAAISGLLFLFCGCGFLWSFNMKTVLLAAKDTSAPGTALLAET